MSNELDALNFRINTGIGYLVSSNDEEDFNKLILFLKSKGVEVAPCKYDSRTYNVIAISEDKKKASQKHHLSYYGGALEKNKVRIYDNINKFISEF